MTRLLTTSASSTVLQSLLAGLVTLTLAQGPIDPDTLLNYCLDSKYHKAEPGPEAQLYKECSPWSERSCCTHNTSHSVHHGQLYNFNLDHCERPLSDACRRHFQQDHCFFECSPNVGPWVVKVDMKTRRERFFEAPLCSSTCVDWFEACAEDLTCTNNWMRNFHWRNGTNKCPPAARCRSFRQIYRSAKNFCQTVWDDSWQVVDDRQPCMQIWFQHHGGNPNDVVAQQKVNQLRAALTASAATPTAFSACYIGVIALIILLV